MSWKIQWRSYVLDKIELVYEKAEENEAIGKMMEALETQALAEAKNNCGTITTKSGNRILPEQFDALPDTEKEAIIKALGGAGLTEISRNIQTATIVIRLSPRIQSVQACTVFYILNRLEKLNGSIELIKPKWTLDLQIPVGGNKGLKQWEMLIIQLYPWLSVRETSTNEAVGAHTPVAGEKKPGNQAASAEKTAASSGNGGKPKPEKTSFWKKLFDSNL